MGIFRGIGRFVGSIYDVRADKWVGYNYLQSSLSRSARLFEEVVKPQELEHQETFEEAMSLRGLGEAELATQISKFTKMIWVYVLITIAMLTYTIIKGVYHIWFGFIMGIGLTFFCAGHIFRYHYWRYLLLERDLGRTPKEWFRDLMGHHRE